MWVVLLSGLILSIKHLRWWVFGPNCLLGKVGPVGWVGDEEERRQYARSQALGKALHTRHVLRSPPNPLGKAHRDTWRQRCRAAPQLGTEVLSVLPRAVHLAEKPDVRFLQSHEHSQPLIWECDCLDLLYKILPKGFALLLLQGRAGRAMKVTVTPCLQPSPLMSLPRTAGVIVSKPKVDYILH